MKKKLLILWALAHLCIVTFSAAKFPVSKALVADHSSLFRILDLYSYITGTGYHYGFFAPGVTTQMRASYACMAAKQTIQEGVFKSENVEGSFRVQNIVEHFWSAQTHPEERRSLASAFALRAFSLCEGADRVKVSVAAYILPSMRDTAAGILPSWEPCYSAVFRKPKGKI